ncbi:Glycosyl hydrolases family 2, sugar binding domain [Paenibacillus sp. 1_12]|uniref:sensor histidine kinase n=1 Tax=Paenibacillus sp. 1_12 TaxID=1566278 RepID=UPI0008EF2D8B|nr:ATP-binding protein [Paenibacillus sp. 1_12]SFM55031.1 Glycosyl hydrolases family 2, sugar binding domain [Paenibacillus sp. 1_12]
MRGILRFGSRTILLYIAAAVVVGLVASYAVISSPDSPKIESKEGILDLTQVHVSENPLKLQGEWAFYWQELLSPEDIQIRSTRDGNHDRWISIPSSWLGYRLDGQWLNGTGYATFRVVIQLSEQDRNERLALRLPTIFHAYKLWVNGDLLAEVGAVGQDKSSVTPQLVTKLVFFQPENDRVELVMQVANFHHKRGGITKYIELGGSDVLTVRTNLKIAAEMFITASLLVIGVYHLLLFMLRRKDRATLYFGLFTVLSGIRSLLVGELLLTQLWPAFPWGLQFKIEYLILCSIGYIMTGYFDSIFPNYVSRWFHIGTRIVTSVFCIVVVVTPAIIYTKMLLAIGVMLVLHMVYLMIGLVQAAVWRMEGALIFLLVSVVAFVTVINDFLYYNEWSLIGNTSPLGLLVFTIAQMMLLSSRFTRAASNEERIARELQDANNKLTDMNMNLERTVQERTQALSAAHDDLRTSYDRLLHSEQGRKKLLAYITHDLRMPLSSMLGYVEAVQDRVKPERNEQYLKYIRDNTIRINRMIEELSFLSHLETGQVSYRMEPVHVFHFLRGFFEQYELVVRDAGLDFMLEYSDVNDQGPNSPVVEMDTQRLEQALFNLVSNAMKFTPRGGVVTIALAVNEANHTRYATISVQDSGTGIPPEQLEQIFDRNYRYDRPDMEKGVEGSGLGLAICREIVQAHGGTVRAESDGQTGSIFYVSIPCIREEGR